MKKIIVIGGGDAELTAKAIAELENKGNEVVLVDNVDDTETSDYKVGGIMEIKDNGLVEAMQMPFTPPPTRAERRKEARKQKKRKK